MHYDTQFAWLFKETMVLRQTLKQARRSAAKTQKEIAKAIGISERMYQDIERGIREGKGETWDKLEALFEYEIPQRKLREQTTQSS